MIRDIDLELNVAALGGTTHSLRKRTDHGQRLDLAGNGHGRDATRTGPAKLDIPRQRPAGMKDRNVGHCGKSAAGELLKIVVLRRRRGHEPRGLGGGRLHDRARIEQAHRLQREKDECQKRRQQKSGLDRRLRPVLARGINTTRCP